MAGSGAFELRFDERQSIERLLKEKYKTGGIANILARSHSCSKQEIRKNGGKSDYKASVAQSAYETRKEAKNRKLEYNFSASQIEIIHDLLNQNKSASFIASQLKISMVALTGYFRRNGIKMAPRSNLGFHSRISALEDQIKILTQLIKELRETNS